MKHLRRLLALALAAFVTAGPATALAADTSATSRSISILSVDGSSATVNKGGKKNFSATKGMKLASGYTVTTGKSTTLYFQVDDDKAIKLDSSSSVTISTASGKKLKLTLKSGKMFFNVKKPLDKDTSMSVSAGGSSMSIRGTSGYVLLRDDQPAAGLFSGKVDWVSGVDTYTLSAGEQLTETAGQVEKTALTLDSCPAFAAVAALENKDTIDLSPFVPEGTVADALETQLTDKWQAEQTAAAQAENSAMQQAAQAAAGAKPNYELSKPAGGGSSGGGSSDADPVAPTAPVLQSIASPVAVTKDKGTNFAGLGLPATVTLTTDQGSKTADVTWNAADFAAETYNTAQTVTGTVTLPDGVTNPNNVPLTASISVTLEWYVTGVEQANISVSYGASFDSFVSSLPATRTVHTNSGDVEAAVTWSNHGFDPTIVGQQTVYGSLTLPNGLQNPDNLSAACSISVSPQAP